MGFVRLLANISVAGKNTDTRSRWKDLTALGVLVIIIGKNMSDRGFYSYA